MLIRSPAIIVAGRAIPGAAAVAREPRGSSPQGRALAAIVGCDIPPANNRRIPETLASRAIGTALRRHSIAPARAGPARASVAWPRARGPDHDLQE